MSEVRKLSKKGVPYMETVVADVSSLIPADQKGKFLLFDPSSGCLVTRKAVPKSTEEKKAGKEARFAEVKGRWSAQVKRNAEISKKLKSLAKEVSALGKEIRARSLKEDVSALQDQRAERLALMDELRAERKPVPKKYL